MLPASSACLGADHFMLALGIFIKQIWRLEKKVMKNNSVPWSGACPPPAF